MKRNSWLIEWLSITLTHIDRLTPDQSNDLNRKEKKKNMKINKYSISKFYECRNHLSFFFSFHHRLVF